MIRCLPSVGGLADRLVRFGITEPGVCGRQRECVGNCRAPVQRKVFVAPLIAFTACARVFVTFIPRHRSVASWRAKVSPFPLLIPRFFPALPIKAWSVHRRESFLETPLVYGPPLPDSVTGQNVARSGQEEKKPQICEQHVFQRKLTGSLRSAQGTKNHINLVKFSYS